VLLYGLSDAPAGDPDVRRRHAELVGERGRSALHEALGLVDPTAAARLAPNDFIRVSRALEVFELTGVPMSEWQRRHGFRSPRMPHRLLGVRREPDAISERIAQRTRQMLDAGWVDEVRALLDSGWGQSRAMGAVGYRQVAAAIQSGSLERDALQGEIVRATRVFARRQRTWLRDASVQWLTPEQVDRLDETAACALSQAP
jgi:tRNA dimethylallyltransferase